MKLPSHMKSEFPNKVYVKWWGWPIIFRKLISGGVEANWVGWLLLLFYIFPKAWFHAVRTHKGINITFQSGDCNG